MATFADFTNDYLKKKKKEEEEAAKRQSFADFTNSYLGKSNDDIAPVRLTEQEQQMASNDERKWFQKGAFEDGYQFGDVLKSIGGSVGDLGVNALKGVGRLVEGVADLGGHILAGGLDLFGQDELADSVRDDTNKSWVDEKAAPADEFLDNYSFFGDKGDAVGEGLGQVAAIILTGGALGAAGVGTAGVTATTTGIIGASSMGSGMSEAYLGGATDGEAVAYGLMKGTIDAGTELLFGGLGKTVKAVGLSKGISSLDDIFAKKLSSKISNQFFSNAVEFGVKSSAEGLEEVLAGLGSAVAKKLTYMSDEELNALIKDENLLDQFIVGTVTSGIAQSGLVPGTKKGSLIETTKQGKDFVTGLTANEQSVVDKVYEDRLAEAEEGGKELSAKEKNKLYDEVMNDLEKGYIDIDTIEEVLGEDVYKSYKDTIDYEDDILKQFEELGNKTNPTLAEQSLYAELKSQADGIKQNSQREAIKSRLSEEVFGKVKDTKLAESYNERARRGQVFEADLSQYDEKQQEVIKRAVDSGILNNTNRTHEFVDLIAKISADKGVLFDFTNNKKLKESGFAVDGKEVNGFVTKDGISINIDSHKALQSTVGHEITHVLEGTELYAEMQRALFDYAKSKGDFDGRRQSLAELYKDIKDADVDAELTADLVGDYLFTDKDFVKHLSTQNRNVFQKMYDEIKYLWKLATAGSKEARELEKVKRAFDKAYKESGKAQTEANTDDVSASDTKYSISVTDKATIDFLENQEHITTYKAMQLIDGKLYPPMAAKVKGEDGKYRLNNPSELGKWQQATEDPTNIKKVKNGVGYYTLNKGNGKSIDAAYNPYEHSSNLVLNDQFEEAYNRDNIVTVECEIPVSEMTSGYKAEYAKDGTGVMDWKSGVVAGKIKDNKRKVYLSRWLKPVRILSDAETAAMYKDVVGDVSVPFNVVTPNLLTELEKAGVNIDYDGSPMYKSIQRRKAAKSGTKYSLSDSDGKHLTKEQQEYFKDSVVRDENGNLKVMYHGTKAHGFTVFDHSYQEFGLYGNGFYFTDDPNVADGYSKDVYGKAQDGSGVYKTYLNITNPIDMDAYADKEKWVSKIAETFDESTDVVNAHLEELIANMSERMNGARESVKNSDMFYIMRKVIYDLEIGKHEAGELAEDCIRSMGYDGITHIGGGRFNNKDDNRHRVYIAFSPEQIKNIDNAKPTDSPDIRYSLSDSDGKKLTKEQSDYFKDSKARDENGNLLKVYHTTANDFTVFDKSKQGDATGDSNTYMGFFFADDAEYMQNFPEFENGKTDSYYLNITNPIDMTNISKEAFMDVVEVLGGDVTEAAEVYDQELADEQRRAKVRGDNNTSLSLIRLLDEMTGDADYHTFIEELKPHYNELMSKGYDGVVNYLDELFGAKEYIVLDSNQAKLTSNTKPTGNADIRYSLSADNENVKTLDGDSVTKYSLSTWTPDTQAKVRENLIKVGYEADRVDKWINDTNSVASVIAADKARLDFEAADNQVMLKDNQEYIKTLDASTLCAKRLVYQGTFDAIQHRMPNTMLSSDDLIDLLNMMKEHGVQTPCGVCYVESRRRHLGKFAQDWLNGYNGEYKPKLDEVTTSDGLEALRKIHPQTYQDFVDAMNKKGSSNPKVVQLRTEYRNEIMSLTPAQIRKIEAIGGLRVQSFSDFETPHMLDMMQAVMDMSAKGLHSQAYTKVPNFAWVFGDTGIKINLSLIAEGDGFDADGNLAFSSTEGMSIDDAMKLRDAYSENVGTIIVGANDKHILACMADDRIDFIIPFHRSGWGMKELEMMGMSSYTDYTYGQKEHDLATGKGVANLYPPDYWDYGLSGKENAERYLNLCAKTGREPKFSKFLVNNGDGSYSLQPDGSTDGYWKTLIDFKMYNNEGIGAAQQKVQPNFNMSEAYRVLNEYEGGANKLPVANEVVEEFVAKYQSTEELAPTMSLSEKGEAPTKRGTPLRDLRLETEQVAPMQETISKMETVEDYAPITEEEANALQSENIASINDADAPPEVEVPYYGETQDAAPIDPFEDRNMKEVSRDRKTPAYMYENPEVKPFFQKEANILLGELESVQKPETIYNGWEKYEMSYEFAQDIPEIVRTPRIASETIEYLRDDVKMSYADIEKGLKAIIEDNGAENIAAAKKLEFVLNDRLLNGYYDDIGLEIPADQEYINLLTEKQISEYSEEARKQFFDVADAYAPIVEDEIAPTREYEAITPKPDAKEEAEWAANKMARADSGEAQKTAEIWDTEPETGKKKSRGWSRFRTNFLDKQSVFEDLALKTNNRELMGKANYMLSSEQRAQRMIGKGKADAGVKSLNDIRAEVESTGLTKQFYEYMYHKHNVDRMSLESQAKPTIDALRSKFGHLKTKQIQAIAATEITEKTTERTAATIREAREYLNAIETKNKPVFGSDVTAEKSQEIVNQYEFAQPKFKEYAQDVYTYMNYLRGQMVESGVISQETADLWAKMYPHYVPIRRLGDAGLSVNVPLDTGRTGVNAPIKRAKGGNRDILPLFDTMALRTEQTYKAIAKNNFGVELKNTLGTTIESADTNLDDAIDSVEKDEELLQKGENGRNPTFTVFEDGKRVTFEITEDMYDALKPTSDGLRYTNKVANTIGNVHRGLLTEYNPTFMLTNAIKDAQDILINSQHPAKTYANLPSAITQMAKNGAWYQEYMENGGESNTYFDGQSNTFTKDDTGIKKIVGMPLRAISAVNNYVEMAPRLAEYIASRKAGASAEVAMLDAARVTTNFAAGGDVTKFANRNGFTFLNASVQGAMQQVRNVREAKANGLKGWVQLATKVAIAGIPAMILNNLLWDDDEEYEQLSDYVKDNYYVVAKFGDGQFVRIPKGRALAVIQDALEQVGNALTGNDEVDLANFLELAISNLAPNNPLDNNILAPIGQVMSNKTWYGEDLVPTRLQDLPAAEQFDESTDSISKWLGETLNISPYKLNYLLNQYSGGIGDVVLPMLTPEAESGDNSLVGNLIAPMKDKFTTDSVMNNQNVSDFYDTVDELAANAKSSYATDEDILKYKYMNSVNAELSELYKQKRAIQNKDIADKYKYEAVRDIQKEIDALAEESLNTYGNVQISNGYAVVGDRYYKQNDDGEWQKITDKQLDKQEEVTSGLGIDPAAYWENKSEYDFAYEQPGKYGIAKAVGGYENYKTYASDLYDIKADKDENGKTISGSRKEKVAEYINNLDISYEEKLILFKSEYNADDSYNREIIEYLNNREDITYEEMVAILQELGFTVKGDTVTWD